MPDVPISPLFVPEDTAVGEARPGEERVSREQERRKRARQEEAEAEERVVAERAEQERFRRESERAAVELAAERERLRREAEERAAAGKERSRREAEERVVSELAAERDEQKQTILLVGSGGGKPAPGFELDRAVDDELARRLRLAGLSRNIGRFDRPDCRNCSDRTGSNRAFELLAEHHVRAVGPDALPSGLISVGIRIPACAQEWPSCIARSRPPSRLRLWPVGHHHFGAPLPLQDGAASRTSGSAGI
ncbi:hypothetical protein ACJ73_01167 [Blastomyces percursus]|uniref:Uncharacterized protein n=1 Tax=Blastomyces percursus TaxID=1658174 RepID=A0A1J9RFT0_9EURO|nr:hypothetical protein ACJ73_01167 [Blastomyces percursus]